MNIIVSNKQAELLNSLSPEIDIIKAVSGEFSVDQIIEMFNNMVYNKCIIDLTAIKHSHDLKTLQQLAINMPMSKVILVLDNQESSVRPDFLSGLVSMGIYNFTRNREGIIHLINNPNTIDAVAKYQTSTTNPEFNEPLANNINSPKTKIIGFKNVSTHAGATSLIFMCKRLLATRYKVGAIELNKNDFSYYRDKDMISTDSKGRKMANIISLLPDKNVILIDLNDSKLESECDQVIYLLEPSIIKMNKLVRENRQIIEMLKKEDYLVLNQSMLVPKSLLDFEHETKLKIFFNLPPINDREIDFNILPKFLQKLGFNDIKGK